MSIKTLRRVWLSILCLLIGALLWRAASPLGRTHYETNFSKDNYFIGKISPQERATETSSGVELSAEPAYFSLYTPRPFSRATLTIDFSSPPALVEAGLRQDKTIWSFDLKPVYSSILEQLSKEKNTLKENGILLWQKEKTYSSIADFTKHLPALHQVVSYRYPLPNNFQMSESGVAGLHNYRLGLRGAYQFYTYSSGEPIDLTFFVKDRSEILKLSPLEINLYRGAELISSAKLADENITDEKKLRLLSPKLKAGVYRVEIKANDDIVTNKLTTAQAKIAFAGRLWIVEDAIMPLSLWSDSESFTAQTDNPASRHVMRIDGTALNINESYRQFVFRTHDSSRRLKEVVIGRKDMVVSGDGLWSYTKDTFFNPTLRTLNATSELASLNARYIIANYSSPEPLADGTYRARMEFDLSSAYREKGKYSFMISAPAASLEKNPLLIKRISIDLSGANALEAFSRVWK